jgi:transcriptional regulator with XRE-family HTH domain
MKGKFDEEREAAALAAAQSLRKIREALGWSQRELAERMGLKGKRAQSTVGEWETGVRPISYNVLENMAEALGQQVSVEVRYKIEPLPKNTLPSNLGVDSPAEDL